MEYFLSPVNRIHTMRKEEEEFHRLEGRIRDLSRKTYEENFLTHTSFLSEEEQAAFLKLVKKEEERNGTSLFAETFQGVPYILYGGYEEAQRRVICFLPDYLTRDEFDEQEKDENEVIACLEVKPENERFSDVLTHRDFLGAIMNLGLERNRVGDILTDSSMAYVYVAKEAKQIISQELVRVKHTTVTCREVACSSCTIRPRKEKKEGSVSSERIDALTALFCHISRGKAQDLIKQEMVFVNGAAVESAQFLNKGDKISVRGYGKFCYQGIVSKTKKGKLIVAMEVYR